MAYKQNKIQSVLLIQLIKLVSLHYLWKDNNENAVKKKDHILSPQDCLQAISQTGPSSSL